MRSEDSFPTLGALYRLKKRFKVHPLRWDTNFDYLTFEADEIVMVTALEEIRGELRRQGKSHPNNQENRVFPTTNVVIGHQVSVLYREQIIAFPLMKKPPWGYVTNRSSMNGLPGNVWYKFFERRRHKSSSNNNMENTQL